MTKYKIMKKSILDVTLRVGGLYDSKETEERRARELNLRGGIYQYYVLPATQQDIDLRNAFSKARRRNLNG